jgi:hypothetical protein
MRAMDSTASAEAIKKPELLFRVRSGAAPCARRIAKIRADLKVFQLISTCPAPQRFSSCTHLPVFAGYTVREWEITDKGIVAEPPLSLTVKLRATKATRCRAP